MNDKVQVSGRWLLAGNASAEKSRAASLREQVTGVFLKLRLPVNRYLLLLCGSPSEAEELAQEAFLRLYNDVLKGRRVDNMPAWVFRVADNLAMDRQRRCDVEEAAVPTQEALVQQQSARMASHVDEKLVEKEKFRLLREALAKLTPQERQCLELRAEGLRYREIAGILGIGIPTVQTFLSRGVKK